MKVFSTNSSLSIQVCSITRKVTANLFKGLLVPQRFLGKGCSRLIKFTSDQKTGLVEESFPNCQQAVWGKMLRWNELLRLHKNVSSRWKIIVRAFKIIYNIFTIALSWRSELGKTTVTTHPLKCPIYQGWCDLQQSLLATKKLLFRPELS